MSKAFDTINRHTLISKLIQTKSLGTIIKFIANYIKRCTAYTTYRNNTARQRYFKTDVPQGGILSPTLFNIYNSPPPNAPIQVMALSRWHHHHIHIQKHECSQEYIQPYLHNFLPGQNKQSHTKSRQNNLHSDQSRPCRI